MWWLYHSVNPETLWAGIRQVPLQWYLCVLAASILCHILRAERWRMTLQQSNHTISWWQAWHGMMSGYLINMLTGRLGEIARCYFVHRRTRIPFLQVAGTVFIERVIDAFVLLTLCMMILVKYHTQGATQFRSVGQSVLNVINQIPPLFAGIGICTLLIIIFLVKNRIQNWLSNKGKLMIRWIQQFRTGVSSIFALSSPWKYILYSISMWCMYVLMTWFWFYGYAPAHNLNLWDAILIVAWGGIGRSLPVPGLGAGTYHFFAIQAMVIAGMASNDASVLAFLIHAGQTLFYLIFCLPSVWWMWKVLQVKITPDKT